MDDGEARERVERLEAALEELEGLPDQAARAAAMAAVSALVDLYGEGLARIVARASNGGADGLPGSLAEDEVVAHLLLLHGLHPKDAETRVREALDEVRPQLESHGGEVELVGVEDGAVRVRAQPGLGGCGAPDAEKARAAIEEAVLRAAPEVEGVEIEGLPAARPAGIELPVAPPGGGPDAPPSGAGPMELPLVAPRPEVAG